MAYNTILADTKGRVGIITLDRPEALNALNDEMAIEILDALTKFEADDKIGCIIVTGSEKVFAAGADIKEMQSKTYMDVFNGNFLARWDQITSLRKPIIAAVAGYALGGGCELAMICDFIIAADNAKFGQPEITIGAMPGMGGSQRLTRFVGKSKSMEMCLTGRMMDATEAERSGLVSRIVPVSDLLSETLDVAGKIADFSAPVVMMTKEAVNRAYETTLTEGVKFERRVFHSIFATEDQKEGMKAFIEKRTPQFNNK